MIARCPHDWSSPQLGLACLDDAEVVLRCERNPSVLVRFAERHAATDPLDRRMFFAVDAQAPAWTPG
ncbi:hypothetical protein [Lentzea guizhouensis]|uniref:hypothetical protein n=1 Tax=Lentzea guizhouensis TaxID=1586287 RepID=UPI001C54E3C7|nr:hypothetical protein [Lentzea guizhouensis]